MSNTFSMYQGDSKNLIVSIYDENNNIVDITGSTFKWSLDLRPTPIVKNSSSGDIVLSNATQGEVTIHIYPNDSSSLTGIFFYELEMTDRNGNISTVIQDKITILRALIN